jgi:hypothetical protein
MTSKWNPLLMIVAVGFIICSPAGLYSQTGSDQELLRARERVWRAWFAGDAKTLRACNKTLPEIHSDSLVCFAGLPDYRVGSPASTGINPLNFPEADFWITVLFCRPSDEY